MEPKYVPKVFTKKMVPVLVYQVAMSGRSTTVKD